MFPSWNPLDEGMFEIVLLDRYWCEEAEEWLEMPDYLELGFVDIPERMVCTLCKRRNT